MKTLKLNRPLDADSSADLDDVLLAKTYLCDLGFYEPPEWGLTEIPDMALFDAIRAFQQATGLMKDGIMKPGGETENAVQKIHAVANRLQNMGRGGDTILAHITPREARLLHAVTDGGSINPVTGLPEFFLGDIFSGLSSSFSNIGESFMSGLDSFSDSLSSGLSSFGDTLSSGFDSLSDSFSSSSSKPKATAGSGLNDALKPASKPTSLLERTPKNVPGWGEDKLRAPEPPKAPKPLRVKEPEEPWYTRAGIPDIGGYSHSSNRRNVDGLLKSSKDGDLPFYQADALTGAKPKAMDEYGDFMKQLHDKNPGRAKGFEKDVLGRLSPDDKAKLGAYTRQVAPPRPTRPAEPRREIKIDGKVEQKGSSGTDQLFGGAGKDDLSNGKNPPTVNQQSEIQGRNRPGSDYKSPVHQEFRDRLNKIESDKDGYKAHNPKAGGIGAHGRYQMRKPALQDAGLIGKDGKWTGKYGVKSAEEFRNNPVAQERAFVDYMKANEGYLQRHGAFKTIGKTFPGKLKKGIKVTEAGLLAAAHKEGSGGVSAYLNFQMENGWSSDFSKVENAKIRRRYEAVETRLRLFQNTRYR